MLFSFSKELDTPKSPRVQVSPEDFIDVVGEEEILLFGVKQLEAVEEHLDVVNLGEEVSAKAVECIVQSEMRYYVLWILC